MGMRADDSDVTAQKGILAVLRQFVNLGWGPIENKHQDLGTDLYIQVRDRGFELGILIGAQVKTGPSYFGVPSTDPTLPAGWWYAESDKKHFNYWTTHALPHLLVLHDLEADQSYWVHVTREAVVDTGKGAKILVPSANTLDTSQLSALQAVASTGRGRIPLEGTLWTGGAPAASSDQFRFALIAIGRSQSERASHASTPPGVRRGDDGPGTFRRDSIAEDATGPSGQGDLKSIPSFDDAASSTDWRWRFAAVLESRILYGDLAPLKKAIKSADTPDRKTAATVALVSAFIEDGHYEDAIAYVATGHKRHDRRGRCCEQPAVRCSPLRRPCWRPWGVAAFLHVAGAGHATALRHNRKCRCCRPGADALAPSRCR
jgi:hypothetical protein